MDLLAVWKVFLILSITLSSDKICEKNYLKLFTFFFIFLDCPRWECVLLGLKIQSWICFILYINRIGRGNRISLIYEILWLAIRKRRVCANLANNELAYYIKLLVYIDGLKAEYEKVKMDFFHLYLSFSLFLLEKNFHRVQ